MKRLVRLAWGALSFAIAQGTLFSLQTYYVATEQFDHITTLAVYLGLVSIFSYLFDGNSGLIYTILRRKMDDASVYAGFIAYRIAAVLAFGVVWLVSSVFSFTELEAVAPFIMISMLIRLACVDGTLDRRELHHVALALNYAWMPAVAVTALIVGNTGPLAVGTGYLLGSIIMAAGHLLLRAPLPLSRNQLWQPQAIMGILSFMGLTGFGQLYGRLAMSLIGLNFSGPLIALILYAKQIYNISGSLLNYIRRSELTHAKTSPDQFRLVDQRASIMFQLATIAIGLVATVISGLHTGVPWMVIFGIIVWQSLEKIASNATYFYQLMHLRLMATFGLVIIATIGVCAMIYAAMRGQILYYVAGETAAFVVAIAIWTLSYRKYQTMPPSRVAEPAQ